MYMYCRFQSQVVACYTCWYTLFTACQSKQYLSPAWPLACYFLVWPALASKSTDSGQLQTIILMCYSSVLISTNATHSRHASW